MTQRRSDTKKKETIKKGRSRYTKRNRGKDEPEHVELEIF